MDSDKDKRNKIKPKIVKVNKITPMTSSGFQLKLTFGAFGRMINAMTKEIIITGMLIMKIEGQCHCEINKPPIVGPNAADVEEKIEIIASARACFDVIKSRTMLIPLGNKVELPMACKARQPSKK